MPIPLLIPAAIAAANMIGRFVSGNKQTKESKTIKPIWQQYQTSPFAKQQLGLAKNLFSSRMAGAPQMERNIFANNANFNANVGRNATSGSQALALAAAGQGQTDQSFEDLQLREAQNKYGMLGNLNQAYGQMIGEGNKEYQSMLQKYGMDTERKDALRNAGAQNKYGAVSDLASMGFGLAGQNMFGNMFGQTKPQPSMNYSDFQRD